jgi:hypothetical protein
LSVRLRADGGGNLVSFTNVSDDDMTIMHLARQGYGSVNEISEWDSPQLLDAVEYEHIRMDLERYHAPQAQDK